MHGIVIQVERDIGSQDYFYLIITKHLIACETKILGHVGGLAECYLPLI